MRESTTYQGILREGREEGLTVGRDEGLTTGRVEGERNALLLVLRTRFGSVPANVEARIRATADVTQLEAALVRAIQVTKPEELFS